MDAISVQLPQFEMTLKTDQICEGPAPMEEDYETVDFSDENKGNTSGELKRPDLKGSFQCSICSKIFCHSSSLSRHRMQAHFKSYKCTLCSKEITSNETLRTHMFKQHQISRMFMCRCCNWAFPDKTSLHVHVQATQSGKGIHVPVIGSAPAQPNQTLLQNFKMPIFEAAIPVPEGKSPMETVFNQTAQIPTWLTALPRPIPTTEPMFIKKELDEPTSSQSESSTSSMESTTSLLKSPGPSAFREARRTSPLHQSPTDSTISSGCFRCDSYRSQAEHAVLAAQTEITKNMTKQSALETAILNMHQELTILRQHNQLFQAKLVNCQSSALRYLQSDRNPEEAINVLNQIVQTTFVG